MPPLSQYVCACACVCVSARAKSELFGTDHKPCLKFPSNTSSMIPDELPACLLWSFLFIHTAMSPRKGADKSGGFTRVEGALSRTNSASCLRLYLVLVMIQHAGVGGTPSKRPVSAHVDKARSPSKVGRESGGTREGRPGWRVVGPYASSPLSSRSPYGNPYGRPRARSSDPHSSPH